MPLLYGRIIHYEKRKNQKEKNLFLVFLVRVSRFELEAS